MERESAFQSKLIRELKDRFPGFLVLKNDADYIQGIPDLLVLYGPKWAALECKRTASAPHRPNQDYYVEKLGGMGYASFIYPENKEEVLHAIQQALEPGGATRVPLGEQPPLGELRLGQADPGVAEHAGKRKRNPTARLCEKGH
jgi:hypothetical protein